MNLTFSKCAKQKIREKCSLIKEEIARLYEDGKTIPVSTWNETGRINHVFWSKQEKRWFVMAIAAEENHVITILDDTGHRNGVVSIETLQEARRLVEKPRISPPDFPTESNDDGKPKNYRFQYWHKGKWKNTRYKVPVESYPGTLDDIVDDQAIIENVFLYLGQANISIDEVEIMVRYGKLEKKVVKLVEDHSWFRG